MNACGRRASSLSQNIQQTLQLILRMCPELISQLTPILCRLLYQSGVIHGIHELFSELVNTKTWGAITRVIIWTRWVADNMGKAMIVCLQCNRIQGILAPTIINFTFWWMVQTHTACVLLAPASMQCLGRSSVNLENPMDLVGNFSLTLWQMEHF